MEQNKTEPKYYYLDTKYGKYEELPEGGARLTVFPDGNLADFLNGGSHISQAEYDAASKLYNAGGVDWTKIRRAVDLAVSSHWGQTRKTDDTPYIVHPFAVATLLTKYTQDPDIICAALCHDVLEQGIYATPRLIKLECSERVLRLVQDVTEPKLPDQDRKTSWKERKEVYLTHLYHADEGALLICAADKIHNLRSMIEAFKKEGDAIWAKFNSPADKKLWFYRQVLTVLKKLLTNPIVDELESTYNEAVALFGSESDTL